mmetsp:Transcript_36443/g.79585  ORF Transcript_36443/g.79585 Transcript_36443/m.79585 type:complete len:228 (-) Transcript_36443:27-710(-)
MSMHSGGLPSSGSAAGDGTSAAWAFLRRLRAARGSPTVSSPTPAESPSPWETPLEQGAEISPFSFNPAATVSPRSWAGRHASSAAKRCANPAALAMGRCVGPARASCSNPVTPPAAVHWSFKPNGSEGSAKSGTTPAWGSRGGATSLSAVNTRTERSATSGSAAAAKAGPSRSGSEDCVPSERESSAKARAGVGVPSPESGVKSGVHGAVVNVSVSGDAPESLGKER